MMRLFNHVLVPIDFTEKNDRALQIARQIAEQNKADVSLVHVVETIDDMDDAEMEAFYARLKERSIEKMDPLAAMFSEAGIQVYQKTLIGKPAEQLVRYVVDDNIDLIILSSHKFNPAAGKGWATLSYQVSLICPCPVLLVK